MRMRRNCRYSPCGGARFCILIFQSAGSLAGALVSFLYAVRSGDRLFPTLGTREVLMFIKRYTRKLREWWQSPVTAKDRAVGAVVGGLGGFWIGVLGRIMLGALPMSST